MANRNDLQKRVKAYKRGTKRRGKRYARFSGSTTKTVSRMDTGGRKDDKGKDIEVFVGLVSLSKQVVNIGSTLNKERMQSYYDRAPKRKESLTLADVLGLVKDPRYAQVWWETPAMNHINMFTYPDSRLDMWFDGPNWFFIDLDFDRKIIRRSRDYGKREYAMTALQTGSVLWVEEIPIVTVV